MLSSNNEYDDKPSHRNHRERHHHTLWDPTLGYHGEGHRLITSNTGGWVKPKVVMLEARAEILLLQEHKLLKHEIHKGQNFARKHGWASAWEPAMQTNKKKQKWRGRYSLEA